MAAKNSKVIELKLSNVMNVKFTPDDANGHTLMKAREAANGIATVIYLLAEIATFNGEKLPAPEILNFSAFDIITLESAWADANPKK